MLRLQGSELEIMLQLIQRRFVYLRRILALRHVERNYEELVDFSTCINEMQFHAIISRGLSYLPAFDLRSTCSHPCFDPSWR
jgi:hypothetical protein